MRIGTARWFPFFQFGAAAALGGVVALAVSRLVNLEMRYFGALILGVLLLSAGMIVIGRIREILLYILAFNLAFTTIEKSFFISPDPTFVVSAVSVGLAELALAGLYVIWIGRILMKQDPLPTPNVLDLCVLAFLAVHVLSLTSSLSPMLTMLEVVRLTKLSLLYFYLSRNVEKPHLKYIVAGILFAIAIQAVLGVYQHRTGRLMGIGRTKGAAIEYEQYEVPGFETVRRAEGTTFDSHALGLFFSMTLPIAIMLALNRRVPKITRAIAAGGFGIGMSGLAISFSRAGWLSFSVAVVVLFICLARWRQWRLIVGAVALGVALALPFTFPFARYVKQRIFEAPRELMTIRVETLEMARELWRDASYTGIGANAYMVGLQDKLGVVEGEHWFVPAHNMVVMLLVEMGPLGVVSFMALSVVAAAFCWRVVARSEDPLLRSMAAALLAAVVALHVEGLTDPMYVTGVTYYLVWFELGLIGAVYRLAGLPKIRITRGKLLPAQRTP